MNDDVLSSLQRGNETLAAYVDRTVAIIHTIITDRDTSDNALQALAYIVSEKSSSFLWCYNDLFMRVYDFIKTQNTEARMYFLEQCKNQTTKVGTFESPTITLLLGGLSD